MVNFVICDDNKMARDINKQIISKILMSYDFDYKIDMFSKYNLEFKEIIKITSDLKIYILDLEIPGKSGIEIAKEIRKKDWDSVIIVLTSHDELELRVLKEKLLIFDFISKFEDYEKRLTDTIKVILDRINNKKIFSFKLNHEINHIKLENIYCVYKSNLDDKIIIVTDNKTYKTRETLLNVSKKLDKRFKQTHRACYVNIEKIKKIDFKNQTIYFENNKKIDLLSRKYKNNLKEY